MVRSGDSSPNHHLRAPSRTVTLGRIQPQAPTYRTVYCNDRDANFPVRFKGNSISTTKYNVFTFLPKGLFEQFRRIANIYFLGISCLSMTPISPVNPITNVAPLSMVLLVSLIKEAFEDWTANLDGETNLKIRKALEKTWDYLTSEKASEFKGEIQCEQPNNSLYIFTGNLIVEKQTLPLSPDQLLLRGCSLRNTEYIVGAVIFTGHETKVMMNAMNAPSKRSTLEKKLGKLIITIFCALVIMCLIGAIGWQNVRSLGREHNGLHPSDHSREPPDSFDEQLDYQMEEAFGGSILAWLVFAFVYCGIITPRDRNENVYFVIYVLMSTFYFYFTLLLVPVVALLADFIYQGAERWFFPYDYQIVQEIHRHKPDSSNADQLEIANELTPEEARSYAISPLPREISKHTGFAFDSSGYESFFASQLGIYAPQKAWTWLGEPV